MVSPSAMIEYASSLLTLSKVHCPVLDGLGDVLGLDFFAAVQVGYCAGYPQDAVVASGGETHDLEGVLHKARAFFAEGAVPAHGIRAHPGVAQAALILYLSGSVHPLLDSGRRLRFGSCAQFLKMHCRNLYYNVDSVQQRAGNPAAVALHLPLRAPAAAGGIAIPAAFAGVHGAHQHEFRWVGHRPGDPGNGHFPVFQRLAHQVQGILPEFRHFVQKQHALVGHGNFTGPGIGAAAGKARVGDGVVGRTEGPPCQQGLLRGEQAHNGVDLTDLQCFLPGHIRQDRRQALAEHTFSGAGRADEQHIVTACGSNLQCPLYVLLPKNVLKVQLRRRTPLRHPWGLLCKLPLPVQSIGKLTDSGHGDNGRATGQGSFRRVFRRDKQRFDPRPLCSQRHGQHAGHGTNLPVQTDLPQKGAV